MFLSPVEWSALWLSFRVATLAIIISLPPAIWVGYLLSRWKSTHRVFLEMLVNLPLVLPPVVTGYLLLVIFGTQGPVGSLLYQYTGIKIVFNFSAVVLAAAVISFPLMVRSIRQAFLSVNPRLELASRTLGAGPIRTFFKISLPLASRGVIAGCVLGFARSLGEFGATIMIAGNIQGVTQTLPLAIYSLFQRTDGVEQSWRLVVISILIACGALLISELLERKSEKQ